MAKEGHDPKIQWALVSGEPRYISDFYDLRDGPRPEAICLQCGQPLSMRLGDHRTHHYAHLPGSSYCAASEPETALHQNVKFHFAAELAKSDCILIHQTCKRDSWYSCGASQDVQWLKGWSEVEVEYRLDPYRPDIALLANAEVIGAIEIFVTHAVEPDKAEYLQQLEISWLEVKGDEALYTGESAWRADNPMPYLRLHPKIPDWTCDDCLEREAQLAAKRAEEAEHWQNNHKEVISYRFVDYFWPSGDKYRDVFAIVEEVRDGERVGLWLMCRKKQLCDLSDLPEDLARKKAMQVYERALDYVRQRGGKVDSPMSWKRGRYEVRFETSEFSKDVLDVDTEVFFKDGRYRYRYAWWKAENRWFLPKANRDINWDDPGTMHKRTAYYERE